MTEEKKDAVLDPVKGHLVVDRNHQDFLVNTTVAIGNLIAEGYEVETNYQTTIDQSSKEVIHSVYLVGRLQTTPELAPIIDYVRKQYVCGDMPDAVHKGLMELIKNSIK